MWRLLVLCVGLVPVYAQTPPSVTMKAGFLSCGIVRRSSNQVQTYCFYQVGGKGTFTLVCNEIYNVAASGALSPATCSYEKDLIYWQFQLAGTAMSYSWSVDGVAVNSGVWP